ncbi:MAG: S8 family serine peptidase [Deltaproteobacteria bacterium]|nr:S8 family serine peptidase [Deltaproteobacteria bacterium]MBL7202832.1 S8 family serine peptidase [Desulfobacteraceae bacterium]
MKNSKFVVILFSIFVYAMVLTPLQFANAFDNGTTQRRVSNYEELREKAFAEGHVKVIIELNVPNIEKLTKASRQFTGRELGKEAFLSRSKVDSLLAEAINSVGNSVVDQLNGTDFRINHTYLTIPYLALDVSAEALSVLESLPEVLHIVEDIPVKLNRYDGSEKRSLENPFTDNGPEPPNLNNTISVIGADVAWGYGYTGSGWYVAILDTGIRPTHEMFAGKTIVEACFSLKSACPNGSNEMYGSGAAEHYYGYEEYDHGTHVSGIAAGNSGTIFGVAKNANIIAVQVFSPFTGSTDCGSSPTCVKSYPSDQLKGLEYVYSIRGSYSIAAVNMSLGGGQYSSWCDSDSRKAAIDNLLAVGIATVIASGNDGYCWYINKPACISSSVAVGATTDADVETSFNNWDDTLLDFFAPGYQVYSATGASDSSYGSKNGTSMAVPHITGAWALLKQYKASGTVPDLFGAINSTGQPVFTLCLGSYSPNYKPRVQVDSALESLGFTVLYVDPSSSCNGNTPCYSTIQSAIDAVSSGSVIKILAGTYAENLNLNSASNYTLQGGQNSTYSSQTSTSSVSSMTFGSNSGTVTVGYMSIQ